MKSTIIGATLAILSSWSFASWNETTFENFNPKPAYALRSWKSKGDDLIRYGKKIEASILTKSSDQVKDFGKAAWKTAERTPSLYNLYRATYIDCFWRFRYGFNNRMDYEGYERILFLNKQKDYDIAEYDRVRCVLLAMCNSTYFKKIDGLFEAFPSDPWIRRVYISRHLPFNAPRHRDVLTLIEEDLKKKPNGWREHAAAGNWYFWEYMENNDAPARIAKLAIKHAEISVKYAPKGSVSPLYKEAKKLLADEMRERGHL